MHEKHIKYLEAIIAAIKTQSLNIWTKRDLSLCDATEDCYHSKQSEIKT